MGITNLTLYGSHICNYLYIKQGELSPSEKTQLNNINFEPKWVDGSEFMATFKNNLTAGNNEIGADFVGWTIYRKNITDNTALEYVATITDNNVTELVDYMVANRKEYKYYLFLNTTDYMITPFVSNEDNVVPTNWDGYTLITTTRTNIKNRLKIKNVYQFGLNIETTEMSNNASINKLNNFTPYPKIQYSNSNHLSGTLKSLVGYVGEQGEYIETQTVINQLRELTTDNSRKFLKDIKGNIFEIAIDDSIKFALLDDRIIEQPYTIQLSWVEVGNTNDVSITYANDLYAWALTRTGVPQYGTQYVWLPANTVEANKYVTPTIKYI